VDSEQGTAKKVYELVIPEWRCALRVDWEFHAKVGGQWFRLESGVTATLKAGDQLRGNGGPEEEYLRAMLAHGYVKEIEPSAD